MSNQQPQQQPLDRKLLQAAKRLAAAVRAGQATAADVEALIQSELGAAPGRPSVAFPGALPGHWLDAHGRQVPVAIINAREQARHELVFGIAQRAVALNAQIAEFRAQSFADIECYQEMLFDAFSVKSGGRAGNLSLTSYCGRWKVERAAQSKIQIDEAFAVARELILNFAADLVKRSDKEIGMLIMDKFAVDADGNLSISKLLELRKFPFTDERWTRAMEILNESLRVVGSKIYLRVYERRESDKKYVPITLNMSAI